MKTCPFTLHVSNTYTDPFGSTLYELYTSAHDTYFAVGKDVLLSKIKALYIRYTTHKFFEQDGTPVTYKINIEWVEDGIEDGQLFQDLCSVLPENEFRAYWTYELFPDPLD